LVDWDLKEGFSKFSLEQGGKKIGPFTLTVPGKHNILNACAAIATLLFLGIEWQKIVPYLNQFKGVERRFQLIGQARGVVIIDDYAHHPTAIRMTIEGARKFYPSKRLWVVFQPHTFSRTEVLLKDFAQSLSQADRVILADIFSSAREKKGEVSSADLALEIKKINHNIWYYPTFKQIIDFLKTQVKNEDLVIAMGAGNIYQVGYQLLKELNQDEKK
jgi:UDP-N-acetylmuramate--alanine ligase